MNFASGIKYYFSLVDSINSSIPPGEKEIDDLEEKNHLLTEFQRIQAHSILLPFPEMTSHAQPVSASVNAVLSAYWGTLHLWLQYKPEWNEETSLIEIEKMRKATLSNYAKVAKEIAEVFDHYVEKHTSRVKEELDTITDYIATAKWIMWPIKDMGALWASLTVKTEREEAERKMAQKKVEEQNKAAIEKQGTTGAAVVRDPYRFFDLYDVLDTQKAEEIALKMTRECCDKLWCLQKASFGEKLAQLQETLLMPTEGQSFLERRESINKCRIQMIEKASILQGFLTMLILHTKDLADVCIRVFRATLHFSRDAKYEKIMKKLTEESLKYTHEFPILMSKPRIKDIYDLKMLKAVSNICNIVEQYLNLAIFPLEREYNSLSSRTIELIKIEAYSARKEEAAARMDAIPLAPSDTVSSTDSVKTVLMPTLKDLIEAIPKKPTKKWKRHAYENAYRTLIDLIYSLTREGLINSPLEYINKISELSYMLEQRFSSESDKEEHDLTKLTEGMQLTLDQSDFIDGLNLAEIYSRKIPVRRRSPSSGFDLMQKAYDIHRGKEGGIELLYQEWKSLLRRSFAFFNVDLELVSLYFATLPPYRGEMRITKSRYAPLFDPLEELYGIKANLLLYLDRLEEIEQDLTLMPDLIANRVATGMQLLPHFLEEICAYLLKTTETRFYEHDFEYMLTSCAAWETLSPHQQNFLKQQNRMRNEARGYRPSPLFTGAAKGEGRIREGETSIKIRGDGGIAARNDVQEALLLFQTSYAIAIEIAQILLPCSKA